MAWMKNKLATLLMIILVMDAPVSTAPQVIKMFNTGSSQDVSIITWCGMFFMALLWTWVAKKESSPKLVVGSALWAVCDLIVAVVAAFFRFYQK